MKDPNQKPIDLNDLKTRKAKIEFPEPKPPKATFQAELTREQLLKMAEELFTEDPAALAEIIGRLAKKGLRWK